MICPFKFNEKTLDAEGFSANEANQCEKEKCAFYIECWAKCCVSIISENLAAIASGIEDLVNIFGNR